MTSIIVPVRYNSELTRVCIDTIKLYTTDYELILVQEGEDDGITKLISLYPDIKFVQNKTPKGYAGALNSGIKVAVGDKYCFLNNDIVATPNWLSEMLKVFENGGEKVGLVCPTFSGTGERQSVDWNMKKDFDDVLDWYSLAGVCFVVPRKVVEEIGTWDESFFFGGEDFDFALRVSNAHYRMVVARKAFIYHFGGASARIYFGGKIAGVKNYHQEKLNKVIEKHGLDKIRVYETFGYKT